PTYKQRLLDELTASISSSLSRQLNYYRNPDDFVEIRAQ
ncbi:MAG: hydrogen peroxide-inducible genes activator, partial [Chryseobacterium sp.]